MLIPASSEAVLIFPFVRERSSLIYCLSTRSIPFPLASARVGKVASDELSGLLATSKSSFGKLWGVRIEVISNMGAERIKGLVTHPLEGIRIAVHYG